MIRLEGEIIDADARFLTVRVPFNPEYVRQGMKKATVFLHDGRKHSRDQHGKVFALIGEIAMWAGYKASENSEVNADMKRFDELSAAAIKSFSMSDGDVTTVSLYITHLIDFILEHNIPTKRLCIPQPCTSGASSVDKKLTCITLTALVWAAIAKRSVTSA